MVERSTRVLLCDDSPTFRLAVTTMLNARKGFEVVGLAHDGEQAIRYAQALSPDVIIMDIEMPKINGIEAAFRIRAKSPEAVIIMFSSAEDDFTVFRSLSIGINGYCTKRLVNSLPDILHDALRFSELHPADRAGVSHRSKTLAV